MKKTVRGLQLALFFYVAVAGIGALASGKPLWVKKAKDLGYPAQNCLYCHTEKLPKKEHAKEQLNDRGKWLQAEKAKKQAKDVEVEWLKDYPGGKEQK
jgi:hypothetical protein